MIYEGWQLADSSGAELAPGIVRNIFFAALSATCAKQGTRLQDYERPDNNWEVQLLVNGYEFDLEGALTEFEGHLDHWIGQGTRDQLENLGFYKIERFVAEMSSEFIQVMRQRAYELGYDISREEDYR